MRSLVLAASLAVIATCLTLPSKAEMVPVETISGWQLVRDADPIFGDLGYRLNLPDSSASGTSTLSLVCTFEETGTISYSAQLTSSEVNFAGVANGAKIESLLRYDEGDIRDAEWLATGGTSVSYSSGGSNFIADNDNPDFKAAVRAANAGEGGELGWMLSVGMVANGIQMLYWRLSISERLALGFGSGSNRRSMLFDLTDGAAALEKMLASCHGAASDSSPEDAPSPREQAPWGTLDTTNGQYKTISLDPGQCLELHPVRHRRGDPLTVMDSESPGALLSAAVGEPDILIEGPKQRLEVYFGDRASAGRFQYRTWDRQAASCAED